jgi:quercetin dioxygenase-like cupin family protein
MPLGHVDQVVSHAVTNPAAHEATMRVLVGPELGWSDHVMRVFDVNRVGLPPNISTTGPTSTTFLSGEGTLFLDDQENPIRAGSYAYVPANALHQFRNTSDQTPAIHLHRAHQRSLLKKGSSASFLIGFDDGLGSQLPITGIHERLGRGATLARCNGHLQS